MERKNQVLPMIKYSIAVKKKSKPKTPQNKTVTTKQTPIKLLEKQSNQIINMGKSHRIQEIKNFSLQVSLQVPFSWGKTKISSVLFLFPCISLAEVIIVNLVVTHECCRCCSHVQILHIIKSALMQNCLIFVLRI